jgi:hypothetical protein
MENCRQGALVDRKSAVRSEIPTTSNFFPRDGCERLPIRLIPILELSPSWSTQRCCVRLLPNQQAMRSRSLRRAAYGWIKEAVAQPLGSWFLIAAVRSGALTLPTKDFRPVSLVMYSASRPKLRSSVSFTCRNRSPSFATSISSWSNSVPITAFQFSQFSLNPLN